MCRRVGLRLPAWCSEPGANARLISFSSIQWHARARAPAKKAATCKVLQFERRGWKVPRLVTSAERTRRPISCLPHLRNGVELAVFSEWVDAKPL